MVIFDMSLSKQSFPVSDFTKYNKNVTAHSGLPREKLFFNCQKTDTCVLTPPTIDDQGSVALAILSSYDVFMREATSINLTHLTSVQSRFSLKSIPLQRKYSIKF